MTISEKSAYLKGLMDGLKLNTESDEGKMIAAIVDLLGDVTKRVTDIEETTIAISDELDEIEEDLDAIEDYILDDEDDYDFDDDDDEQELRQFGADIMNKADRDDCTMPQVPGNRPYKKGGKVPHPKGRRGCNRCSVCAEHCPADAILLSAPKAVDTTKCISCMKCVSVCPTGARSIGMIMNFLATQGLKKVCATRKENVLYI